MLHVARMVERRWFAPKQDREGAVSRLWAFGEAQLEADIRLANATTDLIAAGSGLTILGVIGK